MSRLQHNHNDKPEGVNSSSLSFAPDAFCDQWGDICAGIKPAAFCSPSHTTPSASKHLDLLPYSFLRLFSRPAERKRVASRKPRLLLLLQARSNRSGLLLRLLVISPIILLSDSHLWGLSDIVAAVNKVLSSASIHARLCLFCLDLWYMICLWLSEATLQWWINLTVYVTHGLLIPSFVLFCWVFLVSNPGELAKISQIQRSNEALITQNRANWGGSNPTEHRRLGLMCA